MSPLVGVSCLSLPHTSAQNLLRRAAAIGAECIDLRAGRGQHWEPELDLIAEALPVTFVAVSDCLGAGVAATPASPELMHSIIRRGIALRLFVEPLADAAALYRFGEDVARLRGAWGPDLRLAIETHAAAPTFAQLDAALSEHRVGAVVDTLGLVRLCARLDEARSFLLRHGIAVQVKGLELRNGDYRHVALDASPLLTSWTAALLAEASMPITVETKAGTAAEDIRTLRRVLNEGQISLPNHVPHEVCSCVPAF
jgi:hypothetical protein